MAKTTLVQQLSVQKSENLKAVELFLNNTRSFSYVKVFGLQAEQAGSGDRQIQTNERENK